MTTDAVFTEYFEPDVFVARQRITGDPGIDPDVPLELRVEFTRTGRNGTPSTRYGVYMGIINMMIVVPMLIQTVTFGPIFKNVLGDNPNNAIMFAGILLAVAVAAAAMTRIKEPPIVRDVDNVLQMPAAVH